MTMLHVIPAVVPSESTTEVLPVYYSRFYSSDISWRLESIVLFGME